MSPIPRQSVTPPRVTIRQGFDNLGIESSLVNERKKLDTSLLPGPSMKVQYVPLFKYLYLQVETILLVHIDMLYSFLPTFWSFQTRVIRHAKGSSPSSSPRNELLTTPSPSGCLVHRAPQAAQRHMLKFPSLSVSYKMPGR